MADVVDIKDRMGPAPVLDEICESVCGHKFNFSNEDELQQGLSILLGEEWKREHVLSAKSRLDLYHAEKKIVIEVKVDGCLASLTRQVHRYTKHDNVVGVVVVTSLNKLTRLPETMNGKPVRVAYLVGNSF